MTPRLPLGRRHFLKLTASAAGGLLIARCAPAPTDTPAAPTSAPAATEVPQLGGDLNILGWEGYDLLEVSQPFTEANGITVNSTYITNNDEVLTKFQAAGSGQYDVGNVVNRNIPSMIDQNIIQPVDVERLPNFAASYPLFRESAWATRDGKQFAMPAYFGFDVINYNADLVEAPSSWDVLLDPQYKDRLGFYDSLSSMFIAAIRLGFGGDGAAYTQDQLSEVKDWVSRWKANSKAVLTSYGDATDLLVRGDIWMLAPGWEYVTVTGKKQGANLQHVVPDGPAKVWVDTYVLFTDAPHLDNAYGWLNNTFSPEVMAQVSQDFSCFVTNPDAIPLMPAEHAEAMNMASLEAALDRGEFAFFPPQTQSDPNLVTFDQFQAAWEEVRAS
jgi:spermidine/putrescine-binding protein